MTAKLKYETRRIRIIRLLVVVQAYSTYKMMTLNSELLLVENSWKSAETMCSWMQVLCPVVEHSVSDFLHDKNEIADEALNYYDKHKHWLQIAENYCISTPTLTAFCKNVENGNSVFWLKCLGHLYYGEWLMNLLLYVEKQISKEQLKESLVEYSLFTGKTKPANLAKFRHDMVETENVIAQIQHKQLSRKLKKKRTIIMFNSKQILILGAAESGWYNTECPLGQAPRRQFQKPKS